MSGVFRHRFIPPPRRQRWIGTKTPVVGDNAFPLGFAVPVTVGTPTIWESARTILPGGIAVPVAFTGPTVRESARTILPGGIAVPVAFSGPTVRESARTILPAGIAVALAVGGLTVSEVGLPGTRVVLLELAGASLLVDLESGQVTAILVGDSYILEGG